MRLEKKSTKKQKNTSNLQELMQIDIMKVEKEYYVIYQQGYYNALGWNCVNS